MTSFILENEAVIRLGCFFGIFALIAAWEIATPRRPLSVSKGVRWTNNLGLVFSNTLVLRLLIVTPDMHRVHHSVIDEETNSNFGFNLSLWDRLFGTYRDQPAGGHEGMTIGIRTFRDQRQCAWLPGILTMPFIGKVTNYAVNRRTWDGADAGER